MQEASNLRRHIQHSSSNLNYFNLYLQQEQNLLNLYVSFLACHMKQTTLYGKHVTQYDFHKVYMYFTDFILSTGHTCEVNKRLFVQEYI